MGNVLDCLPPGGVLDTPGGRVLPKRGECGSLQDRTAILAARLAAAGPQPLRMSAAAHKEARESGSKELAAVLFQNHLLEQAAQQLSPEQRHELVLKVLNDHVGDRMSKKVGSLRALADILENGLKNALPVGSGLKLDQELDQIVPKEIFQERGQEQVDLSEIMKALVEQAAAQAEAGNGTSSQSDVTIRQNPQVQPSSQPSFLETSNSSWSSTHGYGLLSLVALGAAGYGIYKRSRRPNLSPEEVRERELLLEWDARIKMVQEIL